MQPSGNARANRQIVGYTAGLLLLAGAMLYLPYLGTRLFHLTVAGDIYAYDQRDAYTFFVKLELWLSPLWLFAFLRNRSVGLLVLTFFVCGFVLDSLLCLAIASGYPSGYRVFIRIGVMLVYLVASASLLYYIFRRYKGGSRDLATGDFYRVCYSVAAFRLLVADPFFDVEFIEYKILLPAICAICIGVWLFVVEIRLISNRRRLVEAGLSRGEYFGYKLLITIAPFLLYAWVSDAVVAPMRGQPITMSDAWGAQYFPGESHWYSAVSNISALIPSVFTYLLYRFFCRKRPGLFVLRGNIYWTTVFLHLALICYAIVASFAGWNAA